jgi:hypothetical protein
MEANFPRSKHQYTFSFLLKYSYESILINVWGQQVRLTCQDTEGPWALYETKQKLLRDGRTRSRNRPLAEKKRPGEQVTSVASHSTLCALVCVLLLCVFFLSGQIDVLEESHCSAKWTGRILIHTLHVVYVSASYLPRWHHLAHHIRCYIFFGMMADVWKHASLFLKCNA